MKSLASAQPSCSRTPSNSSSDQPSDDEMLILWSAEDLAGRAQSSPVADVRSPCSSQGSVQDGGAWKRTLPNSAVSGPSQAEAVESTPPPRAKAAKIIKPSPCADPVKIAASSHVSETTASLRSKSFVLLPAPQAVTDLSDTQVAEMKTQVASRHELPGTFGYSGPGWQQGISDARSTLATSLMLHPDYETGLNTSGMSMRKRRALRKLMA